jgi:hypothetical protein
VLPSISCRAGLEGYSHINNRGSNGKSPFFAASIRASWPLWFTKGTERGKRSNKICAAAGCLWEMAMRRGVSYSVLMEMSSASWLREMRWVRISMWPSLEARCKLVFARSV